MKFVIALLVGLCLTAQANATATDCSGTIATSNVPVVLITTPTPAPTVLLLQNIDNREAAWFSFGTITPAVSGLGSFILPPAQPKGVSSPSMIFLTFSSGSSPLTKLSVTATTVGHKISCAYW